MLGLLLWIFHAPRRTVEWFGLHHAQVKQRRRDYPNGGICWTCGERTDGAETECEDCVKGRVI